MESQVTQMSEGSERIENKKQMVDEETVHRLKVSTIVAIDFAFR